MKIVANGWDLAANPTGVASLFALEWLNALVGSDPDIALHLVVPQLPLDVGVIDRIETSVSNYGLTAWNQIRFDQHYLVEQAVKCDAHLVLYPTGGAPLRSSLPSVTFPPLPGTLIDRSFLGRLGWALRNAGRAGASAQLAILEPGMDHSSNSVMYELPAWVSAAFSPLKQTADQAILSKHRLQPGYVLSFVSDRTCLTRLLKVWRWVTDSVDADQPLLIAGLQERDGEYIGALIERLELRDAVNWVREFSLDDLPALYRQAAGYFHACSTPYGQELRWAMATGVPVMGIETPAASRILREAGYLASPDDVRELAAACITILVETSMADELRQKGLTMARHYHQSVFIEMLLEALHHAVRASGEASG